MLQRTGIHRKIQLSKAVLLRDALTGEPVSSGIWIRSLSGGKVEKRSGGYVLFINATDTEIEFEVESPIYQSRKICVKSDQGAELEDVLMYPSPAYPRRMGYTAVKGRAIPGSILRFHTEDDKSVCRLFDGYKKGEEQISFYMKNKTAGALWYIRKKKETSGTYFTLKNSEEDTELYRLREPLKQDFQIKDTVIYPAHETIADENGEFYVLFRELPQEKCLMYYAYGKAGEEKQGSIEIVQSKENELSTICILEED